MNEEPSSNAGALAILWVCWPFTEQLHSAQLLASLQSKEINCILHHVRNLTCLA